MKNTEYSIDFGNKITGINECDFFESPFSQREKTERLLAEYSKRINTALIAIDGTKFSSNTISLEASRTFIDDYLFLKPGVDGVILTGLNDIHEGLLGGKKSVGITLGVADCAPIIGSTKDGSAMFNIHGGYKGILGNGEESNLGIIDSFMQELKKIGISSGDLGKIHIGPMAGDNFELPVDYYMFLIKNISKEYRGIIDFHSKDYFIQTNKVNNDGKKTGYLNLRNLINTLLKVYGINGYNIEDLEINTTDKNNKWPSYRLYSTGKQDNNNRLSSTIIGSIK